MSDSLDGVGNRRPREGVVQELLQLLDGHDGRGGHGSQQRSHAGPCQATGGGTGGQPVARFVQTVDPCPEPALTELGVGC